MLKRLLVWLYCGMFEQVGVGWEVSDSPDTMRKLCLSTKFPHQEIGEIMVFYVVLKSLENTTKLFASNTEL